MNESGNVPKPGATAKAREAWAKRVDKFATTAAAVLQLVDTASDPSELSALETQYGELPRTFTGEINRDALITRIAQVELAAKSRKAAATATPKEGTPDETVPDEVVPEAKPPTAEELAQRIPDVQEKDLTNLLNANSTGTSFDDRLRTVAEAIADESDDPNALPATMAGLKKALKGASEAMASGSRGIDYLKDNYKNYVAEALAKAKVDLNVAAAEKEQRGTQEKLRNEWEDEKSLQRIESQIQEAAQALGRTPLDTESDPEPLRADGTLVQVKLNDGTVVELERDEKSGNWLVYDKVKNLKNKDIDRLLVSTPHEWGEAGSEQALEDRDTAEQGLGLDLTDAALAKLPEYVQRQRIRFLAARNELRIQREQQGIKPKAPEGPAPDATLKTKGTLAEFAEDDVDAAMDNEPIPQEAPPEAPTGEAATPESYSALVDSLKPYLQARFDEIRRAMDAALAGESLLTPKDVAKRAARIATQNHEFSQTPNGVAVKGALGSMFATIADYASRAPSLSRRVDMLLRRFDMGKVSVEALAEELGQIYESHILRKADKALANLRADRVRGPNIIREKMLKAVREGALSQETYDFFDWLLRQNENIAQDLAISIRSPKRSTLHFSGSYSVLGRLMTLFKYHADDDTAVHEVMHHTEAMMPEDMREAVRKSWAKAIEAAQRKYANDRDAAAFFFFAQKAEYGLAFEQLQHSVLPANEFYQLISPSEFWAVNATNILRGRYEARGSMLMRMRNFMKELIEHLKSGLGLRSDYAVIRGLNSVLRGDGVYEAGVTLDQNASVLFQAKKARAAGAPKKLRDMQKRIAASMSAQDPEAMRKLGKSIEELSGKKIGAEDSRKILARLWDAQSVDVANGTLNLVPVRDVVNMFRKDIPKINDIFKYVDQIIQFRTKVLRDTDAIVDRWQKLVNKFPKGAEAIAQLLVYADYLNFYPLAYKNLTEALARDPVLKEAKQKGNQTEAVKRANDLRAFYEGGVSDDGTPIYGWNDLSKPEFGGGQAKVIFRDSQKAQDTLFKEKTDAMMAKAGRISGNSVYASQLARLLTERIMKAREKKVFSPLMRFGQYWVNIKDHKGFKGGLFSFEDKKQRDEFLAIKRAQYEHNQLPNDLITEGNSLAELRAIMTNRSMRQAFDQIMDLVDRVDILGASGPGASSTYSKDDFKNDVAELFLETLSENDYRKMFQSRKYTPGFSLDALRVFIANQTKQANQLARLKYQEELDLIHAEAIKDLEGKPRSAALKTVVDHVYREVSGLSSGNPPIPPLATAANRIVFFYLLSGLSTAVINTTQTMYSFAYMLNRYGVRAPAAVARGLVKMISPWNPGLGMEVYDANGNRTTEWGTASYINSQEHRTLKKTNPGLYDCLEAVWHHGNDLERFSGEVSRELYERSGTPSDQFGFGVLKKPLRSETLGKAAGYAARKAVDAFGFAFHHVERLTREGTYITCARLEYQKARREGAPHDEAKARAIAAADDMSLETMGDTSTVGRPPVITKTWQGRVMGSLTWYSVFTAGFMTRNIYRLTQGDPEARKLALHLLGASIVTTYMFSGITGQLLYLPVIAAIDMVRRVAAALGDDDDDKEKLPFEDSEGHPTGSYSADLEFKTSILPRLFGPDSEWAKFFGWDEKQAEKFVRGLKYGPISSYTDLNFFNSMSLGGLLRYPSGFQEARSVEEAMNAIGVLDLAPIGSVGLRIGRGLDALRKGENYKAMENFLPAAMSNWVKALRLEKQGLITPDNYEVKAKEFYDLGKRAAQGIGFGSTEAHEKYQEQYLLPGKIEKSVAARKAALTSGYKSAVYLYNKNYSEAAEKRLEKVREKIRAFNHQFPADAIDWNDLEKNTTEYIDIRNSADATGVKDIEAVSKYAPGLLDNRQQ